MFNASLNLLRKTRKQFTNEAARSLACMPKVQTASPSMIYASLKIQELQDKPNRKSLLKTIGEMRREFSTLPCDTKEKYNAIAAERRKASLSIRYKRRRPVTGKDIFLSEKSGRQEKSASGHMHKTTEWKDVHLADRLQFECKAKEQSRGLHIDSISHFLKARKKTRKEDFEIPL